MILPLLALIAGLVFSAHFSTVRTILGLFDRPGYHPPEGWSALVRRTRARQEDPSFPVMVSLGRSLGTLLFVLGGWDLVFAHPGIPGWQAIPAGLVLLLLLYLLGDFFPRLVARLRAERLLPVSLRLQEILSPLFLPAALPVVKLRRVLEKRLGWDGRFEFLNDQERSKVAEVRDESNAVEQQIIRAALDLGETRVREILTPRLQVASLPVEATPEEALAILRESRYSRLPVHEGGLDHIVGILNAKDLVGLKSDWDLRSQLRPVVHVPETQFVSDLLRILRSRHAHLAVVVDEHGAVSGVVTLEDALEEIVGEIRDETDEEPPTVRPVGGGEFQVRGEARLDELQEALGSGEPSLPSPEDGMDADTLAGLFLALAGRIPEIGESVRAGRWEFTALEKDGNRVSVVRLLRLPEPDQASSLPTDSDEGKESAASS
ncbi:MAG TPA: hemolysin family protein [Fibrobacteria bacterium]|nr:hemolysin family protein [Fibrobacteria bacterium]